VCGKAGQGGWANEKTRRLGMVDEYVDKQGLSRLAVGQARGLGRTCRQWDW
jgi:hypothetical protein